MSEDKTDNKKKKEVKAEGSIGFTVDAIIIKVDGEANKELYRLPKDIRQSILDEAVEISKGTIHPFEVTLQEVTDAKKKKGV
jgi:hypothetical protein